MYEYCSARVGLRQQIRVPTSMALIYQVGLVVRRQDERFCSVLAKVGITSNRGSARRMLYTAWTNSWPNVARRRELCYRLSSQTIWHCAAGSVAAVSAQRRAKWKKRAQRRQYECAYRALPQRAITPSEIPSPFCRHSYRVIVVSAPVAIGIAGICGITDSSGCSKSMPAKGIGV